MVNAVSRGMFIVSVAYGPSMVLITCTGHATAMEICSAVLFGGEIARRSKRPQFLFDLLAVTFEGDDEDRREMGRTAASQLVGVDRIAVVLPAASNTGVGERLARGEGLELRNFGRLDAAIAWLGSPGAAGPEAGPIQAGQ